MRNFHAPRVKVEGFSVDTDCMDINEIRIAEATTQPGSGASEVQANAADATLDAATRPGSRPLFVMPSAQAIADAIIRRTLTELRG